MDVHGVMEVDAVSRHRWVSDWDEVTWTRRGEYGRRIGESVQVTEPGRIKFPPHRGERVYSHVVAWRDGKAAWSSDPTWVYPGDTVSVQVPIPYTITSV